MNSTAPQPWPELPWDGWKETADTLHMWTQIVGKTKLALTPLQNHWWNVALYVSARGLTTSAMPWHGGVLEIEFDFHRHELELRLSSGAIAHIPLHPQSVAEFYARYQAALAHLGVAVTIWPVPVELAKPIRFDLDRVHGSYDPEAVERFHQILIQTDALLKRFATGFTGKISPVHFFWGSFDLCVTRFSGCRAAGPPRPDPIQQEAYSHEVSSAGFWPGNGGFGEPAFYSYAAPVPPGLADRKVHPGSWNPSLGEFILRYRDVVGVTAPDEAVMTFLETTYAAAADAAGWNRRELDRVAVKQKTA